MPQSKPIQLCRLNEMARTEFVAVLGEVFEHTPWLAETAP